MAMCVVCGGTDVGPFFRSHEWSCSGRYLLSPEQYRRAPAIPIMLDWCRRCGLARQVPGCEVPLDYVDIARDTARQLPEYAGDIIASLAEFGVGRDDRVVEVGANDGTFLRTLRAAGFQNLIGVEPSKPLAARAMGTGLVVHNAYFNPQFAASMVQRHGQVRAIVCRHTLEHVPDIAGLVGGIADLLMPGGLAFIEVPDSDWIVSELFVHEIWDEHISYFRAGSLSALLQQKQLLPVRMQRVRFRDTRNLLCWAVRAPAPCDVACNLIDDATTAADMSSLQARWDAFAMRLRGAVASVPRPLIAIGASHIQMNFLNFAGLDADIDMMIDDDPVKAGHYAPLARPVPIHTTAEVLASVRAGTILRTAFPYPMWEDRICTALASCGVGSVVPYALR